MNIKHRRDFSMCNMMIGAVIGAIIYILFVLKFPNIVESIVLLVLRRNPYQITDPLYSLKNLLFELVQFFFVLLFIFTGAFFAFCMTKYHKKIRGDKVIKTMLISLMTASTTYFLLNFIGLWFYSYADRLLGSISILLAGSFSEAMIGLALGLFVCKLKPISKGKIKFALAGFIGGWICSLLIFIVFVWLNLTGNELRAIVRILQVPLAVACIGLILILMEKREGRQLEELAAK